VKEWQHQKLLQLIDLATFLNRQCWSALAVGAGFTGIGWLFTLKQLLWAGIILIGACVFMMCITEGIIRYVRWRRKTWK